MWGFGGVGLWGGGGGGVGVWGCGGYEPIVRKQHLWWGYSGYEGCGVVGL